MKKSLLLSLALAAAVSACGRTPAEPESRAGVEPTIQTDVNAAADSGTSRGGNLMGSGH